jgi:HD superfamily phosphodiesterase
MQFKSREEYDNAKLYFTKENCPLINQTIDFVKSELTKNDAGHDWWHIYRVWNLAKTI